MAVVLETLKELHLHRIELADTEQKLQQGPIDLEARRNEIVKLERIREEAREALQKLRMTADEKEVALQAGEEKVGELKVKLNLTRSNKEYTTIQDEIKIREFVIGQLEEEILQIFADQESKTQEVQEHEKQLEERKQKFEKFAEQTEYTIQKLTSRLALLNKKIVEYEQHLDPDTRELYLRMVRTQGSDAMAACENGSCGGCFTAVTPQTRDELLMGKVVRCHSCGRLLYLK